jgi:predicted RNA-binding protein YlxR (DUF448 family)
VTSKEATTPERMCIVTREARDAAELIRFVVAPDGEVTPDLRRRLPGRGVHVTATAAMVATAERKHLFARAFGGKVTVAPGLADRVERLLADAAVQGLALARKGGTAVFGYAKVEQALADGGVVAMIHAAEAAPDGIMGLTAAARRAGQNSAAVRAFTSEQLDLAFGRTNVIHAALLAGPASEHALARIRDLLRYRGEVAFPSDGALRTLTLDEPRNAPAQDL